jgi:hypothetical protein
MNLKYLASSIASWIERCSLLKVLIRAKALRFIGSLLCCQPDGAWVAGIDSDSFNIYVTAL